MSEQDHRHQGAPPLFGAAARHPDHLAAAPVSVAPYDTTGLQPATTANRPPLAGGRAWQEAGRRSLAIADRMRQSRVRALHPWLVPLLRPAPWMLAWSPEERRLRRAASAAREVARAMQTLREAGWVVLHDRLVDGSSAVIDTLLVGPPGLVILGSHPGDLLHRSDGGEWWAGQVPLQQTLAQLSWVGEKVKDLTRRAAPGWQVAYWVALVVPRARLGAPYLRETPQVLTPAQAQEMAAGLRPSLSAMQVVDLAGAIEVAFPPAPLF